MIASMHDRYAFGADIAQGLFCQVKEGTSGNTKRKVAIKIVPKFHVIGFEAREKINNEFQIMSRVSHPNIIGHVDDFEDPSNYYLVMELFPGRTLKDLVETSPCLSEERIMEITSQILDATIFLHQNWICHLNLSPENILVGSNDIVKIIDFGAAIEFEPGQKLTGNSNFFGVPPETTGSNPFNPEFIDTWQVGYLLYYMFSGFLPYKAQNPLLTSFRVEKPPPMSQKAWALFQHMIDFDPLRRFSCQQARSNYWFSQRTLKKKHVSTLSIAIPCLQNQGQQVHRKILKPIQSSAIIPKMNSFTLGPMVNTSRDDAEISPLLTPMQKKQIGESATTKNLPIPTFF